jgi:sacsin
VGSVLNDSGWKVASSQISDVPFIDHAYFGEEIYNYKEELKLLGVIVDLSENYQVVIENLKSPSNLASLTAEAVLLILECIRHLNAPIELLNSIKRTTCLKTNIGFKTPSECFLSDPVWGCILEVFNGLPVIDHKFYGEKIFTYKDELKQTGVRVDFNDCIKEFASLFEHKASEISITQQHVISFLSCCRLLEGTDYSFPSDFSTIIRKVKWLHTSVDGFRCPSKCILYGPEWESISSITCLPFINYSDKCCGLGIHEYKAELKSFGVVSELKDGVRFVLECLNFPSNPSTISPDSVFSLLECIRLLMKDNKLTIEDDFRKRLSKNWLKTHAGYRPPEKCLLFDSKWSSVLNPTAGPFIDENFYGPKIASFQKELNAIGVISEVKEGCSLLASHLQSLSDHDTIVKIYKFLCENNWKPEEKDARKIWILDGVKGGKWVDSKECIVHDPAKLFGSKFYVLEDIYDNSGLLLFFYFAMEIKNKPSLEDYVDLWNDWGSSREQLSYDECCRFWMSISKHLSTNEEKKLAESMMKLPIISGNNEIFLVDKEDAFIPDNLHMKKLFEKEKVFVWYPQYNMTPLSKSKLSDIYRKIGARNISESLSKDESSLVNDGSKLKYVDPNNFFNLKGLVKIILGFLACSSLKMEPKKRHEVVQSLINLSFHETMEPISVSYSLSLSSGDIITKKANKRVRWESQSCNFIIQKTDGVPGDSLKDATNFSEAISEGILRENHDHVPALAELITLGFVMKFKSEEVDFLMESKNLQIDIEDEEFLSSAFPFD